MNGMILSHIPIHTESLGRFGTNIHGHLHANRVMMEPIGKYGIPVIDEDLDADYGPNDIDACLGLADLELRRVLRLIDGRLDNIAAIKQEEWREIGQAEMDAAR